MQNQKNETLTITRAQTKPKAEIKIKLRPSLIFGLFILGLIGWSLTLNDTYQHHILGVVLILASILPAMVFNEK
jgi:hypothetical protein